LPAAVHVVLWQSAVIFTTNDKFGLVVSGTVAGLLIVLEEIGWTGFAVPLLRRRYSILVTGLIVGSLWGAWHFLQALWTSGTYAGALPLTVFLPLSFLSGVAQLTVYRVLLVWLYDRTGSLLLVTLMHASLTANTVFIFRPVTAGMSYLIYVWVLTAVLSVVAAAMAVTNREQITQQPLLGRAV
jgi:membrane protease YdiL (CAAX protease family)